MTTSTARRDPGSRSTKPVWLHMKEQRFTSADILRALEIESPPVMMRDVATRLGIHVHLVSEPGWEGAVSSDEDSADIWLRAEAPKVRRRFTLAHEIGHLMLHPLGSKFRDVAPATATHPPAEAQANAFAAALLMPRFMLEPLIYNSRLPVADLATTFEVSNAAMEIRIDWIRKGRADL